MTNEQMQEIVDNLNSALRQTRELVSLINDSLQNSTVAVQKLDQTLKRSGEPTFKAVIVEKRKDEVTTQLTRFNTVANEALALAPTMSAGLAALVAALNPEE